MPRTPRSRTSPGRALTVALTLESAFYEQALELSDMSGSDRDRRRAEIVIRYAPRGARRRQVIEQLLEQAAVRISVGRVKRVPTEELRPFGLAALPVVGACAFYPGDELRTGDAQRRPKVGRSHNASKALWIGAQLLARRGAGRCLRLECDNGAVEDSYCRRCASDEAVRLDCNRRLKLMEPVWDSAVANVVGGPSMQRSAGRRGWDRKIRCDPWPPLETPKTDHDRLDRMRRAQCQIIPADRADRTPATTVSKTVSGGYVRRGFKSLPLRLTLGETRA